MGGKGSGGKAKPAAIKKAEGNRGHRPIAEGPEITGVIGGAPSHLDAVGASLWRRVTRALPAGVLTAADREILAAYCDTYAMLREAQRQLRAGGEMRLICETPNGMAQTNPLVVQIRQQTLTLKSLAVELGLTPSARTRLESPAKGEDEDAKFFGSPAKVESLHG